MYPGIPSTGQTSASSSLGTSIGQRANLGQSGILGIDPTSLINSLNALILVDIIQGWQTIEKKLQAATPQGSGGA